MDAVRYGTAPWLPRFMGEEFAKRLIVDQRITGSTLDVAFSKKDPEKLTLKDENKGV
jgi:hypothetical protein